MATVHNLKPEKVVKTFEKGGWINKGQRGSHVKLIKPGNPKYFESRPQGKADKIGLLKDQIKKSVCQRKSS
jgi:predicted RNA binding protein YcfA (HicA-like mRNA interferase family)